MPGAFELPAAVFVRFGAGRHVPCPLRPQIKREEASSGYYFRSAPATVLTWGPLRVVLVWSRGSSSR